MLNGSFSNTVSDTDGGTDPASWTVNETTDGTSSGGVSIQGAANFVSFNAFGNSVGSSISQTITGFPTNDQVVTFEFDYFEFASQDALDAGGNNIGDVGIVYTITDQDNNVVATGTVRAPEEERPLRIPREAIF